MGACLLVHMEGILIHRKTDFERSLLLKAQLTINRINH